MCIGQVRGKNVIQEDKKRVNENLQEVNQEFGRDHTTSRKRVKETREGKHAGRGKET